MLRKAQPFSVALLHERYEYDPLRGVLISKAVGRPIKCKQRDRNTYVTITYGRRPDRAVYTTTYGRLVVAWLTGEWPSADVDHIDRNTSNNRAWNLRVVTRRANAQNRSTFNGGASKNGKRWRARIRINGKIHNLGHFDTEYEAQEAYKKACQELL